jgi:hypothetical protein
MEFVCLFVYGIHQCQKNVLLQYVVTSALKHLAPKTMQEHAVMISGGGVGGGGQKLSESVAGQE